MSIDFFQADSSDYHRLPLYLSDDDLLSLAQCAKGLKAYQTLFKANVHSPSLKRCRGKTFCYSRNRFHRFIARQRGLQKLRVDYKDLRTAKPGVWEACATVKEIEIVETWDLKVTFLSDQFRAGTFQSLVSLVDHSFLQSGLVFCDLCPPVMTQIRHLQIDNAYNNITERVATLVDGGRLCLLETLILEECTVSLMNALLTYVSSTLKCLQFEKIHRDTIPELCAGLQEGRLPKLEVLTLKNTYAWYDNDAAEWYSTSMEFGAIYESVIRRHQYQQPNQALFRRLDLKGDQENDCFMRFLESGAALALEHLDADLLVEMDWEQGARELVRNLTLASVKHLTVRWWGEDEDDPMFRALCGNKTIRNLTELELCGRYWKGNNPFPTVCHLDLQGLQRLKLHVPYHKFKYVFGRGLPALTVMEMEADSLVDIQVFLCIGEDQNQGQFPVLKRLTITITSPHAFSRINPYVKLGDRDDGDEDDDARFSNTLLVLLQTGCFPQLNFLHIDNFLTGCDTGHEVYHKLTSYLRGREIRY
jgi:hypothetical protein